MDDETLDDCRRIAEYAYRKSRVLTGLVIAAFIVSAIAWVVVACTITSGWWFGLATFVTFAATVALAFRLVEFGSYQRFLKTMSDDDPDCAFAIVKRADDGE